ncbi:MAG TPA: phosphate signaling complex protein PhoU [Gammaproteobacteria bacterium]|nr:phosphate signaling complex protein PhoU [Gammaproteobacteria bacterium]
MDNIKTNTHISQQFNAELEDIRSRVLAMGGLVEKQVYDAVTSLVEGDVKLAETVIVNDYQVNAFEVAIDEECTQTLVRRQPAASDLRLIIAVIKTITDLERIGDQAEKVARMAIHLAETERPRNQYMEIMSLGKCAHEQLHKALDAFARTDVEQALAVAQDDANVDQEYEGIIRQRITFMMEDPRLISTSLNVIWAARALERIGDHARNLSEYVIYLVRGKDVRHISLEQMEIEARGEQ